MLSIAADFAATLPVAVGRATSLFSELPAPESSEPVDIESVSPPRREEDEDDEVTSRSVPDTELGAGFRDPLGELFRVASES